MRRRSGRCGWTSAFPSSPARATARGRFSSTSGNRFKAFMRSRITRILLWTGAALGGVLLIGIAALWMYTQTDAFRALVQRYALDALGESIDGEVTFGRLTGSIWRAVGVENISVKQNGVQVLAAPSLTIKMSLLRQGFAFLYSSELRIAEIAIHNPSVVAIQNRDKRWNLTSLVKKKQPDEP